MINKKRVNRNIIDDFEDNTNVNNTRVINNETLFNNTEDNEAYIMK